MITFGATIVMYSLVTVVVGLLSGMTVGALSSLGMRVER